MSKLAVINPGLTPEQIDLVKRTICKNATNDELQLFLHQCHRTGLDPLSRQIYFQKYKNNTTGKDEVVFITAVDGYRAIANRSGVYAGSDDPVFDNEEKPRKATVTVYKMVQGQKCAFTASARWDQYYPSSEKKAFMWKKMPHLMLGKVAEALALRKAFPAELSAVYTEPEMDQAENQKSEPAIEIYTGTAEQNAQLKTWCEEFAIAKEDKPKILAEIIGKTMQDARNVIEKFGSKVGF